jgi:hypothetical protein
MVEGQQFEENVKIMDDPNDIYNYACCYCHAFQLWSIGFDDRYFSN